MRTPKESREQNDLFTSAHNIYSKGLKSYAFYKIGNRATSEDLVQNAFIKTWGYMVKGGIIITMKPFLYHILNNLVIDEYRKRKTTSLDVLLDAGFEPGSDERDNLYQSIDAKSVVLLIKKIPLDYQEIITMRYVQDLSISEIASATGLVKSTVAVRAHRGLEKLKTIFQDRELRQCGFSPRSLVRDLPKSSPLHTYSRPLQ